MFGDFLQFQMDVSFSTSICHKGCSGELPIYIYSTDKKVCTIGSTATFKARAAQMCVLCSKYEVVFCCKQNHSFIVTYVNKVGLTFFFPFSGLSTSNSQMKANGQPQLLSISENQTL